MLHQSFVAASAASLGRYTLLALAFTVGVAAPAVAAGYGDCQVTGQKGEYHITPATPGQLTVEVSLPAPGWWNGDTPDTIKDGYEYCMAADIAYRAGLDKVDVVNVSWAQLIGGHTTNYDLALSEASITEPRKKVVDFSTPYFNSDIGILVKTGTKVDNASVKGDAYRRASGHHRSRFHHQRGEAVVATTRVSQRAGHDGGTECRPDRCGGGRHGLCAGLCREVLQRHAGGWRPVQDRRELRGGLSEGIA